jgi:cytochrome c oxidase cbb3-type subunit IV
MKFQNYLEKIVGVDVYPIISLSLFFLFFCIVTYRIFNISKQEIKHMEELPLND